MTQKDRNELFEHFYSEHNLLLTSGEITEIIKRVTKNDDDHSKRLLAYRINMYRLINVFLLVVLNVIFGDKGMNYIFWLFISYNLFHLIFNIVKSKLDGCKSRMGKK